MDEFRQDKAQLTGRGQECLLPVDITIVAVVRKGIDWAAYWGDIDDGLVNWQVVDYGTKLPESAAREFFPDIEERYRWP